MIKFKITDHVGEIRFDRPAEGNAFTGEMVRQFHQALNGAIDKVDVLVLTGEGTDFTIGRDRKEPKSGAPYDAFRYINAVNQAIAAFPGIIIASVRGRAHGLGVGLTMRSDIAIAADDARFALDEVSHDIPPMFIMEAIVDHLAPKHTLDIILSGREFDAEEALKIGLLSRVVPEVSLDATVHAFAKELVGRDRAVVQACKAYLRKIVSVSREARSAFALVEQTEFAMNKH
jgi:enoyl-CoA hydratase/carnithine racemase